MPSRSVHALQSIRADGPRSMPIPASGPRSPSRSAELGSRKGLPKLDALNMRVPQTGGVFLRRRRTHEVGRRTHEVGQVHRSAPGRDDALLSMRGLASRAGDGRAGSRRCPYPNARSARRKAAEACESGVAMRLRCRHGVHRRPHGHHAAQPRSATRATDQRRAHCWLAPRVPSDHSRRRWDCASHLGPRCRRARLGDRAADRRTTGRGRSYLAALESEGATQARWSLVCACGVRG